MTTTTKKTGLKPTLTEEVTLKISELLKEKKKNSEIVKYFKDNPVKDNDVTIGKVAIIKKKLGLTKVVLRAPKTPATNDATLASGIQWLLKDIVDEASEKGIELTVDVSSALQRDGKAITIAELQEIYKEDSEKIEAHEKKKAALVTLFELGVLTQDEVDAKLKA